MSGTEVNPCISGSPSLKVNDANSNGASEKNFNQELPTLLLVFKLSPVIHVIEITKGIFSELVHRERGGQSEALLERNS